MIEIRPARELDYDAYVRLFAEFQIPDPIPGRDRFVESIAPQIQVACQHGLVVGFISSRPYGELLHVVQLAVDRQARGQRIGQLLLEHVRDRARAAGCSRWYLNVKRDNAPAIKLYERVGFRFELESVAMAIDWARVPDREVSVGLAAPEDDPEIQRLFGIPIERIAMFRGKGKFALVTIHDAGITGFAAFDPSFPGAATFRTTCPELGVDLLAAMRAFALPEHAFVRVTVEDDRPLVEALIALGAEVTFEILRLSAAL